MKFAKMHGTGNDYVYINCYEEIVNHPSDLAKRVSNRNFGVGSDGLILIKPSNIADCKMEMYNADGSIGEMCGNGIRCVAKYVYEKNLVRKEKMTIETLAGVKNLELEVKDNIVTCVTVNMGEAEILSIGLAELQTTCVSVGNPHCILFVEDVKIANVEKIGSFLEKHEKFPNGTNVEFVQVVNRKKIKMRVWERGSGETLSCGTGACASLVASVLKNYTDNKVEVEVLGGNLLVEWNRESNLIYMKGPALEVFSGEFSRGFYV